jgi:predicted nucleic acid-binding Zn ribbon protein
MKKLKKCTVCGKEFMSERGIEVCSEKCRLERKHRYDTESNYRRYRKESNIPKTYSCKNCGKHFEGLGRRYCSEECRLEAKRKLLKEYSKEYYNTTKQVKENEDG